LFSLAAASLRGWQLLARELAALRGHGLAHAHLAARGGVGRGACLFTLAACRVARVLLLVRHGRRVLITRHELRPDRSRFSFFEHR